MYKAILSALLLLTAAGAEATEWVRLELHQRVQLSDAIVVARVVDPDRALVSVERILKGSPARQITLVSYVDNLLIPEQRRPLVGNAVELLFLQQQGEVYAPLQLQHGRLAIEGDSLSRTLAVVDRLVAFQARAARGSVEADATYVSGLKDSDDEVRRWALSSARDQVKVPSRALAAAVLAQWPDAAGTVANISIAWRLKSAAPFFAKVLTTSANGDERAYAAMALGGCGDRAYVPVLRRVAANDPHPLARALAYSGIRDVIGPEALDDLRVGAKDADAKVRAQAVVNSYSLLELEYPEPRWPRPSDALVAEVRAFLTEMQRDPARLVSDNAKSMLAHIARHRP